MRNYTVELQHDEGVFTMNVKAQNMTAAIEQVICAEDCPMGAIIFRWEGRKGEWNEYVEFDPRRTDGVVFIAQKCKDHWNVFENHPGRKGVCITLATYQHKYLAVGDAQRRAHA